MTPLSVLLCDNDCANPSALTDLYQTYLRAAHACDAAQAACLASDRCSERGIMYHDHAQLRAAFSRRLLCRLQHQAHENYRPYR